jgi:hypothetical protein
MQYMVTGKNGDIDEAFFEKMSLNESAILLTNKNRTNIRSKLYQYKVFKCQSYQVPETTFVKKMFAY